MRILTAIILTLVIVAFPSCKYFGKGKKERLRAEMQARQDSIRVADSIKRAQERLLALENARQDSLRLAEEERRLANETKYNIIVGSFITPEYARSLADEYTAMGYNVKIIKPDESRFELVAAEGHKSLRTAMQRLEQFQDTVQIEAWLYIKE